MTVDYDVILLAAGSSSRFSSDNSNNKVLMPLKDRPVFDYSLHLFLKDERCQRIRLVTREDEKECFETHLKRRYKNIPSKVIWIKGGAERQDSVSSALFEQGIEETPYVLVHDAARPFLTRDMVDQLLDRVGECGAVIPVIPATDSLKRVKGNKVLHSLDRPTIRRVQTPQAFSTPVLKAAFSQAQTQQFYGNEEGELVERIGHQVETIKGEQMNFKLTTPLDYQWAQYLIEKE